MAEAAFDRWITMEVQEHFTELDIDEMALGIAKVAHHYSIADLGLPIAVTRADRDPSQGHQVIRV